jgi:hypothetical protein
MDSRKHRPITEVGISRRISEGIFKLINNFINNAITKSYSKTLKTISADREIPTDLVLFCHLRIKFPIS